MFSNYRNYSIPDIGNNYSSIYYVLYSENEIRYCISIVKNIGLNNRVVGIYEKNILQFYVFSPEYIYYNPKIITR